MQVRVTTLSENTATHGLLGEWGLSMLVEVDGRRILFDTGAGVAAVHNAALLKVDLASIDLIVLSHGHHDHTGGLREVLRRAGPKRVIAHPDIWQRKYVRHAKQKVRYSGIPFSRDELESLGASFSLSREPVKIADGVMTTGEVPLITGFEETDPDLFIREGSEETRDTLTDDLALVLDTAFGLVVISGCAHRGIINTLQRARQLTGKEMVYAVIGGTHLFRSATERLVLTTAALREMGVQHLGVSHCTGFAASMHLAQEFGAAFFLNNAGTSVALPF